MTFVATPDICGIASRNFVSISMVSAILLEGQVTQVVSSGSSGLVDVKTSSLVVVVAVSVAAVATAAVSLTSMFSS